MRLVGAEEGGNRVELEKRVLTGGVFTKISEIPTPSPGGVLCPEDDEGSTRTMIKPTRGATGCI